MEARVLPDGRLQVPRRAEGPGGELGDGLDEIDEQDAEWPAWLASLTPAEQARVEQLRSAAR